MYKCMICNNEYETLRSFSKHVSQSHRNIQTDNKSAIHVYYDLYMIKETESYCLECNNPTTFLGLYGYKEYCSKSCGVKASKNRLKNNEEAFQKFRKTVSDNQTKIWEERDIKVKEGILSKLNEGKQKYLESLTEAERKEIYGWLNKVPIEDRQFYIDKMAAPLKEYWSDPDRASITIDKRAATLKETWKERGNEILTQMTYTAVMNCNPDSNGRLEISKEELSRTNDFLEGLCND